MDLEDFTYYDASKYTEEEKIKRVLDHFVNQVRQDGIVNKYILAFIADGVERHLAGKKPWPAKRGSKTKGLEITFPYYYEYLKLRGSKDVYNKIITIMDEHGLFPDESDAPDARTVERYIKRAITHLEGNKNRFTTIRKFNFWCIVNNKEVPEQFQ